MKMNLLSGFRAIMLFNQTTAIHMYGMPRSEQDPKALALLAGPGPTTQQ